MLPLVAGGLALGGQLLGQASADEEARKRALQGLSDAYAQGTYAAPVQAAEGPDATNMLAGAGLAALDQGNANESLEKKGEEADFGDDFASGLRALYSRR